MSKTQQTLPTVYPELLEGKPLVVRNTFIDVTTAPKLELVCRRSVSAPVKHSAAWADESSDEEACPEAASNEPLHEVRRRVFLAHLDAHAGVPKMASDDAAACCATRRSSSRSSPSSAGLGMDGVEGKCIEADWELASNASTRAVSPSNRSLVSFPSYSSAPSVRSRHHSLIEDDGAETTFDLRGLPLTMTRPRFEEFIDAEGFAGKYSFIYLPADVKAGGCFGHGLINLVSPFEAERFQMHFHGFQWPDLALEPMGVHMSESLQGLDELVERYRNSPLMHKSVPAEVRPAVYRDGAVANFPSPTVRLRPLRVRGSQNRKLQGQQSEVDTRRV